MGGRAIEVTREWLWENRALSVSQMARAARCSPEGMSHMLKRIGDVPRWRDEHGALCIPIDWLRAELEHRTYYDIADSLQVKYRTLRDYLAGNGIKVKTHRLVGDFRTCPCDREAECRVRYAEYREMLCESEPQELTW